MKDSSGIAGDVSDIHRDILVLLDITDGDLRPEHCLFKGKTAT
jgi:hypothetical protein